MSKPCSKCRLPKPLEDYHRSCKARDGRASWCKQCANTVLRAQRKRDYSPEQKRRWLFKSRYGLTPEQVADMLAQQGGVCAMCGELPARPCVDHDHATKAVRSILCHACNIALPYVEDAGFRESALNYLGRHSR